jgi:hypothetical protein
LDGINPTNAALDRVLGTRSPKIDVFMNKAAVFIAGFRRSDQELLEPVEGD